MRRKSRLGAVAQVVASGLVLTGAFFWATLPLSAGRTVVGGSDPCDDTDEDAGNCPNTLAGTCPNSFTRCTNFSLTGTFKWIDCADSSALNLGCTTEVKCGFKGNAG